ncbi:MAG: SDR family NAD(P)-dependent oxidoreductase [Deltaproteobacteria bacterium]|nr:SDR family NAD(P)-dependent oxidoreductase [Deltaproteobacteria bacterium]
MGQLDDRVVVITGAGAAVGRAVALLLAAEGAQVVMSEAAAGGGDGREQPSAVQETAKQIEAAGGQVTVSASVPTTTAGAAALVADAVARHGGVDVLINGIEPPAGGLLLELGEEAWAAVVDGHPKAACLALQATARHMVSQGRGGRIVNTTSLAALQGQPGQVHLATAQAGIYGLTRVAATELQRSQITVNAVAPVAQGTTGSGRHEAELDSLGALTPEHVAPAVLMLASDLCGERTGRVLGVCGSRVYSLELVESRGKLKDQDAPWTAEEIAEHWGGICRV